MSGATQRETTSTAPPAVLPDSEGFASHVAPGPKHLSRFLALVRMARDPLRTPVQLFDKYGDFVRLGRDAFITRDAHLLEDIALDYLTFAKNFAESYGEAGLSFWGNSTGVRSDQGWLRQRRLIQAALLPERVSGYGQEMIAQADRMLEGWRDGETFDLYTALKRMTLRIMIKNQFGLAFSEEEFEHTIDALEAVMRLFDDLSQLELKFDTPDKSRFRETVRRLDEIVYAAIARRRSASEDRGDMLSAWMAARDEAGNGLSDSELRDELVAHLRAGYRNSATVLCWVFVLLHRHPEADAKLTAELTEVLNGRAPHAGVLPRLSYSEKVIKETMRLCPLYPMLGRVVSRDIVLAGYRVPAGAKLGISVWALHRDPRYFDDPERFDPQRWNETLERKLPRHAFFPFGGGPRQCPFKSYGMLESVLLLATIAQRFRVHLAQGERAHRHASINGLLPKDGLQVVITRRG